MGQEGEAAALKISGVFYVVKIPSRELYGAGVVVCWLEYGAL